MKKIAIVPDASLSEKLSRFIVDADGCWVFSQAKTRKYGYGAIHWRGKKWRSNRLALAAFCGYEYPDLQVLHSCVGKKMCINPAHLRWGTTQENSQDAVAANQYVSGERHAKAKFTAEDAKKVWNAYYEEGQNIAQIARKFGFPYQRCFYVIRKINWKQVTCHLRQTPAIATSRKLARRGAQSAQAKLTSEQVAWIRQNIEPGKPRNGTLKAAKMFGVSRNVIINVYKRITYKDEP